LPQGGFTPPEEVQETGFPPNGTLGGILGKIEGELKAKLLELRG